MASSDKANFNASIYAVSVTALDFIPVSLAVTPECNKIVEVSLHFRPYSGCFSLSDSAANSIKLCTFE